MECNNCGKVIEIDALRFLLNLDDENIRICKECKEKKSEEQKKCL